jgi:hypothetical protein
MKEGDFIVAIGDQDVKWSPHEDVVNLIKDAGDTLSLKLVTPMDRNYLKVRDIFISNLLINKVSCYLVGTRGESFVYNFIVTINVIRFGL